MSNGSHAIAVGIDLGTTYSVISRLDDRGRPVTLVNAEGDLITPSAVLIEGPHVVVGGCSRFIRGFRRLFCGDDGSWMV